MSVRTLSIHLLTGALLALTLSLLSLAFAPGRGVAEARPLGTLNSHMATVTVDGQPAPPDTCVRGDSWCAFCTMNPAVQACQAFVPAKAMGTTASGAQGRSGNNLVPGVTTGALAPTGVVGAARVGVVTSFPTVLRPAPVVVGRWVACRGAYGGVAWVLASAPPPRGVIC